MAAPVGPKKVHRYTIEFKIQAVRLSLHPDIQTQDVAHALDIHPFMLSKWKKDYREGRLKPAAEAAGFKPTRSRIERLCAALAPFRILETNIYSSHSSREADLPRDRRNTQIFDFLLEAIQPRLGFVHGKSAVAHLSALLRKDLILGEFTHVAYQGVSFDVVAGYHLSYQWSYDKVEQLAQRLHTHLSEKS